MGEIQDTALAAAVDALNKKLDAEGLPSIAPVAPAQPMPDRASLKRKTFNPSD